MPLITHSYFGTLDTSVIKDDVDPDVLWEQQVSFAELENPVEFWLWFTKEDKITTERLDVFEQFIKNFPGKDKEARLALTAYLKEDSEYMNFHKEELELEVGDTVEEFVSAMKLVQVGLWYCASKQEIIIDYMIDPERSDEILAVRFNLDGSFDSIAWES